ncbi:Protein Eyes Shut [Manis pentadactyla]|nr:Protein Eyes Shut [Manis pentadactyla]
MQKPRKMIIPELELLQSTQLDQTKKSLVADVGGEILEGTRQAPLSVNERSGYFSCVRYYGDSYLEFGNVLLNPQNNISLEFQTSRSYGLLLFIGQDSNSVDGFFVQLFIENGTLKYHFLCAGEAKVRSINTAVKVDDGQKYTLLIR